MSRPADSPTTAMLLAAGRGERMRELTADIPKPMIEVDGRTLLDRNLDRLHAAGVRRCVVNTWYKADALEAHLAARDDLEIVISREDELLETGGGVKQALPLLGEGPFFVLNSDTLWLDGPQNALHRLWAQWDPEVMDILMLLHPSVAAHGMDGPGDYQMDQDGRLVARAEWEVAPFHYMGVCLTHARAYAQAPDGKFSNRVVFDAAEEAERLFGVRHDGVWFHVGTPEARLAAEDFLNLRFAEA